MVNAWVFDKKVAATFTNHMHKHIPNYTQVINKTCDLLLFFVEKNSPILEVGCANGTALLSYLNLGYTNITAVDSSQPMIDAMSANIQSNVKVIHSSNFPEYAGPFDAVICNWTLHFIPDKEAYLKKIYSSLNKNGILILTDKTSLDKNLISLYHKWKLLNGVSQTEITKKQESINSIMYINDVEWYLQTLSNLGFSSKIIDADWVFTSFFCQKT